MVVYGRSGVEYWANSQLLSSVCDFSENKNILPHLDGISHVFEPFKRIKLLDLELTYWSSPKQVEKFAYFKYDFLSDLVEAPQGLWLRCWIDYFLVLLDLKQKRNLRCKFSGRSLCYML